MNLTDKQKEAIARLKKTWTTVGPPCPLPCDDCVTVNVYSESTGVSMTLGIEADGLTHS